MGELERCWISSTPCVRCWGCRSNSDDGEAPAEVVALAEERAKARQERKLALADELRAKLDAMAMR